MLVDKSRGHESARASREAEAKHLAKYTALAILTRRYLSGRSRTRPDEDYWDRIRQRFLAGVAHADAARTRARTERERVLDEAHAKLSRKKAPSKTGTGGSAA